MSSEGIRTYPLLNQNTLPLSFKNKQAFSNDKCYTFQVFSKKRKILSFSPIFFETVLDFCYIMEPSEFCSYPHTLEIGIENQIMFSFTPYTQALNICLLFMWSGMWQYFCFFSLSNSLSFYILAIPSFHQF